MNEETQPPVGHDEIRSLMVDGSLSGAIRQLRGQYLDFTSEVEDAVYEAVAAYLATASKGVEVAEPLNFIFVAANRNMIKRITRRTQRETHYEDELAHEKYDQVEASVIVDDTFLYLKALVGRWESSRMRVVTLLYLEAEFLEEPITQLEAADMATSQLDEEVPWTSIGKTRQRGFERLRAELLEIARETGINPIDGSTR